MSIWKWTDQFSVPSSGDEQLTLCEGNTPLVRSRRIGPSLGLENLYFKLESGNPTGSYKDRFGAAAVSYLVNSGATFCLGTSSGNAGASLAAYSAIAGIPCVLAIVETAPPAKLKQMRAYGAELIKITGFGTDAGVTRIVAEGLRKLGKELGSPVQISAYSHSSEGMTGVESIAFELGEQLLDIDHVFSPSGGGGLTLAVAKGFERLGGGTAVHCVQPEGNDTIAGALREGQGKARSCVCTTLVSGLQVATVIDGHQTLDACRRSGGNGYLIPDEEVFSRQQQLAREEGVFTEPAGAVALAGIASAAEKGEIDASSKVVCLVTGTGFKDDDSVGRMIGRDEVCRQVNSFEEFKESVTKVFR